MSKHSFPIIVRLQNIVITNYLDYVFRRVLCSSVWLVQRNSLRCLIKCARTQGGKSNAHSVPFYQFPQGKLHQLDVCVGVHVQLA